MNEPAPAAAEPAPEEEVDGLAHTLGVDPARARALRDRGLTTLEAVRAAADPELRAAGLSEEEIGRLRAPPAPAAGDGASAAIVARWARSVRRTDRPRGRAAAAPISKGKGSTEVLKKWVDGDDSALEAWIHSPEAAAPERTAPPPAGPAAPGGAPGTPSPAAEAAAAVPASPPAAATLPANLLEREETIVRWLTTLLDRMKSDRFDPHTLLQESQELQRSLFEERERRRQLEEELEQVKRGSVAVIKYIRTREGKAREELLEEKNSEISELRGRLDLLFARVRAAQGGAAAEPPTLEPAAAEAGVDPEHHRELERAERAADLAEREGALRRRVAELEAQLHEATAARPDAAPAEETPAAPAADRDRELLRREGELRRRLEEITTRGEENERHREALAFKDREIGERQAEMEVRRKALEVEARRLEELKKGMPADLIAQNPSARTEAERLTALEESFARREKELAAKEAFLARRLGEAEELEKRAAHEEADRLHTEAVADAQANKTRTGVRRLDDLLFGGLPVGSQVLVGGPAHTGKDVLARLFIADGLKGGQGAIWVVTDRTYSTVREEMTAILPSYPEYEKKGVVRYVDLYSRSLGVTEADKSVRLLASSDKALLDQLTAAANTFATELKEKTGSYRLVFESVSTVTAYLDTTATFRFLQPFIGRRKLDRAAGYYILESGMHSESDLQSLEHMMDGSVSLKVDQLKTFLSVRGITDVQSRAWVGYTFSKKAFNLGSFSLDHIR